MKNIIKNLNIIITIFLILSLNLQAQAKRSLFRFRNNVEASPSKFTGINTSLSNGRLLVDIKNAQSKHYQLDILSFDGKVIESYGIVKNKTFVDISTLSIESFKVRISETNTEIFKSSLYIIK